MADEKKTDRVTTAHRPAGKRQVIGASTASTPEVNKQVARKNTKGHDEKREHTVGSFFPEVASEMRKVIWPTARQMVVYTAVVFGFLILITALVAGVDFLAGLGVEHVLTHK